MQQAIFTMARVNAQSARFGWLGMRNSASTTSRDLNSSPSASRALLRTSSFCWAYCALLAHGG